MDGLISYLNDFVAEQRNKVTTFNLQPAAILIFGGRKFSYSIAGKSVGGSVSAGVVLMRVMVDKFDQRTGELVSSGQSVRASVVLWPAGDIGVGYGGGQRKRYGVGFIWDLTHAFMKPNQFWGPSAGVSWSPVTDLVGLNGKVGILSNSELPNKIDFVYATVAQEWGPTEAISAPHGNGTMVFTADQLMGIFNHSQDALFAQKLKDIESSMNQYFREHSPNLKVPGTGDKKGDKKGDKNGDGKQGVMPVRPGSQE